MKDRDLEMPQLESVIIPDKKDLNKEARELQQQ